MENQKNDQPSREGRRENLPAGERRESTEQNRRPTVDAEDEMRRRNRRANELREKNKVSRMR